MILRCPRCRGQHLELEEAHPEFRRCIACGAYFPVKEDHWQVERLVYDPKDKEWQYEAV